MGWGSSPEGTVVEGSALVEEGNRPGPFLRRLLGTVTPPPPPAPLAVPRLLECSWGGGGGGMLRQSQVPLRWVKPVPWPPLSFPAWEVAGAMEKAVGLSPCLVLSVPTARLASCQALSANLFLRGSGEHKEVS